MSLASRSSRVGALRFQAAGYFEELRAAGYTLTEAREANYTLQTLRAAGCALA